MGLIIKNCANCGRLFVPVNRVDTIYCDCPAPQDPTKLCKIVGPIEARRRLLNEDEAAKLYRNVYMAKQMLVKRNPDIFPYKEMFEYFKTENKKRKSLVGAGKLNNNDYVNWLKEMKDRKVLNNGQH